MANQVSRTLGPANQTVASGIAISGFGCRSPGQFGEGLGFESSGLAAAHAVHNGLTSARPTHAYFHGEKVAFGTLVQLVLEGKPSSTMHEVLRFCTSVGLPITLAEIGIVDPEPAMIEQVAKRTTAEGETIHNEPFEVRPDMVADAILAADAVGRSWKQSVER